MWAITTLQRLRELQPCVELETIFDNEFSAQSPSFAVQDPLCATEVLRPRLYMYMYAQSFYLCLNACTYIYIYTYMQQFHICIYICIYTPHTAKWSLWVITQLQPETSYNTTERKLVVVDGPSAGISGKSTAQKRGSLTSWSIDSCAKAQPDW